MNNDDELYVRWYPPYSSGHKDQPVFNLNEAILMKNFFESVDVPAEIITIEKIEYIV